MSDDLRLLIYLDPRLHPSAKEGNHMNIAPQQVAQNRREHQHGPDGMWLDETDGLHVVANGQYGPARSGEWMPPNHLSSDEGALGNYRQDALLGGAISRDDLMSPANVSGLNTSNAYLEGHVPLQRIDFKNNMNQYHAIPSTSAGGHLRHSSTSIPSMKPGSSLSPTSGPHTPDFNSGFGANASSPQVTFASAASGPVGYSEWLGNIMSKWWTTEDHLNTANRAAHGIIHPLREIVDVAISRGMSALELGSAPAPAANNSLHMETHAQLLATYHGLGVVPSHTHVRTVQAGGVHRTIHGRRHDTPNTIQAAATGAVLRRNNLRSTGAVLAGGANSSGAGGKVSSRPSTANAAAAPSSVVSSEPPQMRYVYSSPRAGDDEWYNEIEEAPMGKQKRESLDEMRKRFREYSAKSNSEKAAGGMDLSCLFPGCDRNSSNPLSTPQKFEEHVRGQHLDTLKVQCLLCEEWLARPYALSRHKTMPKGSPYLCQGLKRKASKGKGKQKAEPQEDEDTDVVEGGYTRWPGDDDDSAGSGDMTGMLVSGAFGVTPVC